MMRAHLEATLSRPEPAPPVLLHPSLHAEGDARLRLIRCWPGFLARETCEDLLEGIEPNRTWSHRVFDPASPGGRIDRSVRNTKSADIGLVRRSVHDLMRRAVREIVQPTYRLQIEWIEEPQLLVYETGGHYAPHPDTSPARGPNARDMDRDISAILYLNDAFEGGHLLFPDLGREIRPEPGLLVTFPSDPRYVHGALPVTRGIRFAIVTWMKARGTVRSAPIPPHLLP